MSKGRIAESIVRKVRDTGGVFTLQDLADYKVIVSRALEGTFLGRKVYTTHTPTSGPGKRVCLLVWSVEANVDSPVTYA